MCTTAWELRGVMQPASWSLLRLKASPQMLRCTSYPSIVGVTATSHQNVPHTCSIACAEPHGARLASENLPLCQTSFRQSPAKGATSAWLCFRNSIYGENTYMLLCQLPANRPSFVTFDLQKGVKTTGHAQATTPELHMRH